MNNAEAYFHIEHLAAQAILPVLEKRLESAAVLKVSVHSVIERPQIKMYNESNLIEVLLQVNNYAFVGTGTIQSIFRGIVENINFAELLPKQLKAFELDHSTLHCHSSCIDEMRKEATNHVEYDEEDVTVSYKHSVIFRLPPESKKSTLKAIHDNLKELKKSAIADKKTVPILTSINFELEHQGKAYNCSLNKLTQKLGFSNTYDLQGNKLNAHNSTWNLWDIPTVDLRDLFKGVHTNTALKSVLKKYLVKGAKINALSTTRFKFIHNNAFYSSYKLIRLYANIGDYRNPLIVIIDINRSGEIVVLNEREVDITTSCYKAINIVNQLKLVYEYLFCSNKHFAKSVLSLRPVNIYSISQMAFS